MNRKLKVVITKDETGYHAHVPELQGCQAHGKTPDEALASIRKVVQENLKKSDDQGDV